MTDAEAEAPILRPPDAKNWLSGKDPGAEKDWRQEEKGMTEDEMAGEHHGLNGHEFEKAPGVGDGQGSLLCCSPWDSRKSEMTWATELNWTDHMSSLYRLAYSGYFLKMTYNNMWSLVPDFFNLVQCFQSLSMLWHISLLYFFYGQIILPYTYLLYIIYL